jgi:hypothetical protein
VDAHPYLEWAVFGCGLAGAVLRTQTLRQTLSVLFRKHTGFRVGVELVWAHTPEYFGEVDRLRSLNPKPLKAKNKRTLLIATGFSPADFPIGSPQSRAIARSLVEQLNRPFEQRRRMGLLADQFRYEPAENAYYCPEGKRLSCKGRRRESHGYLYRSTEAQCAARKGNGALPGLIADYCTRARIRPAKSSVTCRERQLTTVRSGLATKLKLCLPNLSSACGWDGYDYAACGMSASSSCWPLPPRT